MIYYIFFNRNKLDLMVCEEKSSKKYLEISRNYPKVPIVKSFWVFDCITMGKFVDPAFYKL